MMAAFCNFRMEPEWLKYHIKPRDVQSRTVLHPSSAQGCRRRGVNLPCKDYRDGRSDAPLPSSMVDKRRLFFLVFIDGFSRRDYATSQAW